MTVEKIRADFETRSATNIITHGMYRHVEDPHFRPLMLAYKLDAAPSRMWLRGQPAPADLVRAIEDGALIFAFNAGFETLCFNWLNVNEGWPRIAYEKYVDTAAMAGAMGLPRSLDELGSVLDLKVQKDKEGKRLINKFSNPRRARKDEDKSQVYWNEPEDHPEDWKLFQAYCMRDVETEEAAEKRMVPLSDYEQKVFLLGEKINRRGIRIDRNSAHSALALADKAKKLFDAKMTKITGGDVTACTQVSELVAWVERQGVTLESAAKADITELLEHDDIPDKVRQALEIRQEAGKTSVSKLKAMLKRANADGRVRGSFIYHRAGTGRFQSVGVNFANMPRPRKIFDDTHPRLDVLFSAINTRDPEVLAELYPETPKELSPEMQAYLYPNRDGALGRPLHLISDAIRGFIWAAPGHELLQADYSGIEGAVIAWLAGEDWKVKALFDLINDPSLPDMYRRTAASILGLNVEEVTKKHWARQAVGKVSELALGFGGGVPAFYSMSRNYAVKLDPIFEPVWASASEEAREKAVKRYEGQAKRGLSQTTTLSRNAWIACEIIKNGWRKANPAIAQSWRDIENAMREAVRSPGQKFTAAMVTYLFARGFLWARLPSGRCLAYAAPRLKAQVWAKVRCPDGTWSDAEVMDRDEAERGESRGLVKIEGHTSAKVTALGVDGETKRWMRYGLYGGLGAENNTQGVARDLLVNGMFKAEEAGYPLVAHVYDELIAEVPRGFGDLKAFESLICELPPWAEGLPLTAGGWRGKRYRKE